MSVVRPFLWLIVTVLVSPACHRTLAVEVTRVFGESGGDSTQWTEIDDSKDDGPGDVGRPLSYRRSMTIDHTKVAADYTTFPVLVVLESDPLLRITSSNGHVADAEGRDIYFESTASALLDFEIERYDGASGTLIAWVGLPTLSSSEDTSFWLRYGGECPCTSKANPPGVWEASDKAVYHLDHDVKDSTANAQHGTSYGSPPFVSGIVGRGMSFNGTSQYVDTELGAGSAGMIPHWTVSCWVRGTADPTAIDDAGPVMHERNFNIGWNHRSTEFRNTTFFATADPNWWGASFGSLTHGTWYHLVGTYDGTSLTAYKNGVVTQQIADIGLPPIAEPTSAKIGRHGAEPTFYFGGEIDEVRISSTAHSAGWIWTSYNNQAAPETFHSLGLEEVAE